MSCRRFESCPDHHRDRVFPKCQRLRAKPRGSAGFGGPRLSWRPIARSNQGRNGPKSLGAILGTTRYRKDATRASCSCHKRGRSCSRVSVFTVTPTGCSPSRIRRTSWGERKAKRSSRVTFGLSIPSILAISVSDFTSPLLIQPHQRCALATAWMRAGS